MYWLQTIRQHLQLSQEELAGYLGLSLHTIKSVETGRRQLPMDSLKAAIVIFNAIKESPLDEPASDTLPLQVNDTHRQQTKRHHRHCCRKLDRHLGKLDAMQRSYATASAGLAVYQRLAQALAPGRDEEDLARLQWTQRKINEAIQCVKDNNVTAQQLLAAKVAGLRSQVSALERPHQELNRDVPDVNKTDNKTIINDTTTWNST